MKMPTSYSTHFIFFLVSISSFLLVCYGRSNYTTRFPRRGYLNNSSRTTSPSSTETPSTTVEPEKSTSSEANKEFRKQSKKQSSSTKIPNSMSHVNHKILDEWEGLESISQRFAFDVVHETLLPTIEKLFTGNNVSSECQSSLRILLHDASRLKKYAIQGEYFSFGFES